MGFPAYKARKVRFGQDPGGIPEDPGTPLFDQLVASTGLEYLRAVCPGRFVGCTSWELNVGPRQNKGEEI